MSTSVKFFKSLEKAVKSFDDLLKTCQAFLKYLTVA